ncbi:MAG: hypothetical protein E7070_12150 [Bacteroidales bacterium]|jgi:hypothetical protein|nr:hypothetical protein [Bacteroidales bacterium]
MKIKAIAILFHLLLTSSFSWCQTLSWNEKSGLMQNEANQIALIATVCNTLNEECYIMISQRHYVNNDSLYKSFHRKIYGTKFNQTTLGFLIHDQYILEKPIPCYIPETFVKKLAVGEEFKFILSTTNSKKDEVQNEFSNRLLIVPASFTDSNFEYMMNILGFLYKHNQVSVFWEDLSSRFQKEPKYDDNHMIVAQENLP